VKLKPALRSKWKVRRSLICSRTSSWRSGITKLFRRYCPDGRIVLVMDETKNNITVDADLCVPASQGSEAIVQLLRSEKQQAKAG
jgi:hypothetical protein